MQLSIPAQHLFQPPGQIRTLFVFDSGSPVIAPRADDHMFSVGRCGVGEGSLSVDAKSTRQDGWT